MDAEVTTTDLPAKDSTPEKIDNIVTEALPIAHYSPLATSYE